MQTKTFTVKHKLEDGTVDEGTFTVKRLSIKDRAHIGMKKSQLAGGMHCVRDDDGNPTGQGIDEDTDYLNAMIAQLDVALIQKPSWFNLDELADIGVVQEVFKKAADFEVSFFRSTNGGDNNGSGRVRQEDGGAPNEEPGSGNTPTPVVGQEVQAALDA
jgi:hypothetical protein